MTPNKERPGLSPEPTCLCMGRLIPNGLPMGKKAKIRQLVDLTNKAPAKSAWSMRNTRVRSTVRVRFVHIIIIILRFSCA